VLIAQQGWFYTILMKAGGRHNNNMSLPRAIRLNEDLAIQVFSFAGLVVYRNLHGWQIRGDEWAKFLQQLKLDTFMEVNRIKVGKQHHFLNIGGGNVYAQPYLRYSNSFLCSKPAGNRR
jgi:hypothetical protein